MSTTGPDGFTGDLLRAGDAAYDDARSIFNSMIDRRPALIAKCTSPADVAAAIAYGREAGIPLSVRSGGHSVAGASVIDGGVMIDMRPMNSIEVDPAARTIRVGGGAQWKDFDPAAGKHGLATTGGRVSTTGVGGLTLGGGSGWIERKFGLACDNLLEVDLVLADGRTVTASEDEHEDLFWALHGAGGNFGVATSFRFRLHELPEFAIALLLWRPEAGPEVCTAYRDLIEAGGPDELGGGIVYLAGPPEDFVPEHLQGKTACAMLATYIGGEAEMREVIAPLLELKPEGDLITPIPYAELQCMLDDPPGYRNYWSAEYLNEFPDEAVAAFCARADDMIEGSPSQHVAFPWGGAVARGAEDSPLATRSALWAVHPLGLWEDPADDDRGIAWARNLCADMKPWATGATYLNFVGDEGSERVVLAYGAENYERLARIKAEYDPENVFRLNQNIRPAEPAGAA
jgi:FAD/FMN-containing dehydrogenase